jgi:hypothetical protein
MSYPYVEGHIPLTVQIHFAYQELAACEAAAKEQPQLTAHQYAIMQAVKRAIIHSLEQLAMQETPP